MAGRGKQRDDRASAERARVYAARKEFHEGLTRRRSRDNLIAAVGGGALILAVLGGQIAYFTAGPGAPVPTETPAPTPAPTDSLSPAPTAPLSPAPTDLPAEPTPSPTP